MATKSPIPQDFMDSGTRRYFQLLAASWLPYLSLAASSILGSFSPPEMSSGYSVPMTSGWDDHSLSNTLPAHRELPVSSVPSPQLAPEGKHHYEPPGAALSARKAYSDSRIKPSPCLSLEPFPYF